MRLTDRRLQAYVDGYLALSGEKRNEHRAQVGRLLDKLEAAVATDGTYRILKFRRAGSLEKGTSNTASSGTPVDADVAVYFDDDPDSFDMASLQGKLKRLLCAAYPQKSPDDFTERNRTFGIKFQESGLEIDLVPIVALDQAADYGWQCSATGGPAVLTSINTHLTFFRDYVGADPSIRPLLRLAKRWRYWTELSGVSAFMLELTLCSLSAKDGAPGTLEEGIRRLFARIAIQLDEPIAFEPFDIWKHPKPVVIIDPANPDNNVAARMDSSEKAAFVEAASIALMNITYAQGLEFEGETLDLWEELFGPGLRTAVTA